MATSHCNLHDIVSNLENITRMQLKKHLLLRRGVGRLRLLCSSAFCTVEHKYLKHTPGKSQNKEVTFSEQAKRSCVVKFSNDQVT